jgi:hypothetical protein
MVIATTAGRGWPFRTTESLVLEALGKLTTVGRGGQEGQTTSEICFLLAYPATAAKEVSTVVSFAVSLSEQFIQAYPSEQD